MSWLSGMGLPKALLRYVSELRSRGSVLQGRRLIVSVLLVHGALFFLVSVFLYVSRPAFGDLYGPDLEPYLLFVPLIALFLNWRDDVFYALIGLYEQKLVGQAQILLGTLLVGMAVMSSTLYEVFAAYIVSFLITLGYVLWRKRASISFNCRNREKMKNSGDSNGLGRRFIPYALTILWSNILNFVVQRQTEVFFIGKYVGVEEAGYYDLAYSLTFMALSLIPMALYDFGTATFTEVVTKSPEYLGTAIKKFYKAMSIVVLPASALGVLLGGRLLVRIYGADMTVAGQLVGQLSLVLLLSFVVTPLGIGMYVTERGWILLISNTVITGFNIVLDFILIPRFGLQGAVWCVALSMAAGASISGSVCAWVLRGYYFPWRFVLRVVWMCVPLVILLPIRKWADSWIGLFGMSITALVILVASSFVIGIHRDRDVRQISSTLWSQVLSHLGGMRIASE
jgi:O-antigen/teichoic acid export membrane protein